MNKAARTRRWSFSLRSMLIGVAVVSVLCAWFLHHRRQQVLERDRLIAMFQGRDSSIGFRYVLFGWEPPFESAWLWKVASPEPSSVRLRAAEGQPLPRTFCEVARRCTKVEYEGFAGGDDDFLRRCTSANTEEITVSRNGVSGDCLAFVGDCPNLRKATSQFVTLRSKSLEALLNHPRVAELEIDVTADDLSRVEALQAPSALLRLAIDFQFDWSSHSGDVAPAVFAPDPWPAPSADPPWEVHRTLGDFAWLRQCTQLQEVTVGASPDAAFFSAIGRHLQGVERLNLPAADAMLLDALATWRRLRWLCLDGAQITDAMLAQVVRSCPNLHTLEIDEYSTSQVALSPRGLRSLQGLAGVRRLRLGNCKLTDEHMAIVAELTQLEELSLEDYGVNDATLAPLKAMPNLKRISLERTGASEGVFQDLRGDWDNRRPYRS